jgi:hypothetical protein
VQSRCALLLTHTWLQMSPGATAAGYRRFRRPRSPASKKKLKISTRGAISSHVTSLPHPTGPACSHDPCASKLCCTQANVCIVRGRERQWWTCLVCKTTRKYSL